MINNVYDNCSTLLKKFKLFPEIAFLSELVDDESIRDYTDLYEKIMTRLG
jgi:hypothetical protein